MGISRVEYDGRELINISNDSVNKLNLLKGETAHDSNGDLVLGDCPYDMETKGLTAFKQHILKGKTAGVDGLVVTGEMPENVAETHLISSKDEEFTIPDGYHDGQGTVKINPTEMAKLVSENIRENVEILGVKGSMTGKEGEKPSPKIEVDAPLTDDLTILPEGDYTCFKEVVVKKVPYETTDMTADEKGIWVAIG